MEKLELVRPSGTLVTYQLLDRNDGELGEESPSTGEPGVAIGQQGQQVGRRADVG